MIFTFLLGFLLSGIWFGANAACQAFLVNRKWEKFAFLCPALVALPPAILFMNLRNQWFAQISSIHNGSAWLISLLTPLAVSYIATFRNGERSRKQGKALVKFAMEGALMEIPQRLMMLSFLLYLMERSSVDPQWYAILFMAIIWCLGIVIQNAIFQLGFHIRLVRELLASFLFSILIGHVLLDTNLCIFAFIAHFLERIGCNLWISEHE